MKGVGDRKDAVVEGADAGGLTCGVGPATGSRAGRHVASKRLDVDRTAENSPVLANRA